MGRMSPASVDIWRAGVLDLDLLVPLFDAYRQFYELPSDVALCRSYLQARLERDEAVVFLAGTRGSEGVGFTLLYPTFASLHARPSFVLYDLFVAPAGRGRGLGRQLMNRARQHAEESGAASIVLSTAHTNVIGQTLYESLGYKQDTEFLTYELILPSRPR
jgi:ribosomal protein S18 acetylase RimI-like enzyme